MKNLVVVRCGNSSLHEQWLGQDRNFDIVLSYYGDSCPYDLEQVKFLHPFKGSKWEGLADFFQNYPEIWRDYEFIWLPDDDIATNVNDINYFFKLAEQQQFMLCQPALTWDSYFSWPITLQNKSFQWRFVNFVEVMIPCFSINAFKKILPTFNENKSGWGLEFLWMRILAEENKSDNKVAVVDAVAMHHTRPVGSAGSGTGVSKFSKKNKLTKFFNNSAQVLSPLEELRLLMKKYDLKEQATCMGGILKDGKQLNLQDKQDLLRVIVNGVDPRRLSQDDLFQGIYIEVTPELSHKWHKIT